MTSILEGLAGGIAKLLTCDFIWIGAFWDLLMLALDNYSDNIGTNYKPTYTAATVTSSVPVDRVSDEGIVWDKGTDKQIDWAEQIVSGTLKHARETCQDALINGKITQNELDTFMLSLENAVVLKDDANYWIDNRSLGFYKKLAEILEDDAEALEILKKL